MLEIQPISLNYLKYLTDKFSVWQHSKLNQIDRKFGYALDDAARAYLMADSLEEEAIKEVYFEFINLACSGFDEPVNFFDANREPLRERGYSSDALGEVIWALRSNYSEKSIEIQAKIGELVLKNNNIRALAYACLGSEPDRYSQAFLNLASEPISEDWVWPERVLTYANAIIPIALLKLEMNDLASKYLDFLNEVTIKDGVAIIIGNRGWYEKDHPKSIFDQQPIDASYLGIANYFCFEKTNDQKYLDAAQIYQSWFWGNNILQKPLINPERHSVFDGLGEESISPNQGAESTICYLLLQETMNGHLHLP